MWLPSCPARDPKLKDQYVVLSSHMDHLGIGEPINGDNLYNGAMDNASGCALNLDIASSLHRSHAKLGRSVLFVFVTGGGERTARLEVFRVESDGAEELHGGRHQHRHVSTHLSAEAADGVWSG